MTGPSHDAPQWGSGIPGIPSIWDASGAPEPAAPWAPQQQPQRGHGGERAAAQRWGLVAVVLTALVLGGGLSLGGGEEQSLSVGPDPYALPEHELWAEGPPPPGPPAPQVFPEPGVVLGSEATPGLVAQRADGAGSTFGLPLGTAVVLRDATGSRLEVRPLSVVREGDRLLVDLELRTPPDTTSSLVPAVLLRLPDGRELRQVELRGGSQGEAVPPVLGAGLTWRAAFGFDAGPGPAVLVLHDGQTLAGWTVPAA